MTNQINEKTVFMLVVISLLATLGAIIWMLLNPTIYSNNCWDKYQTEKEAILNCEGEQ